MTGMGGIIGAILGFQVANIAGMIIGFIIGSQIEKYISSSQQKGGKKAVQESFFNALFLTMGRIAKADGFVSPEEIQRAEAIFSHMRLTPHLRKKAISLFNQGKSLRYDIELSWRQFGRLSRHSLSLKQMFLSMLLDVAEADGAIQTNEWHIINEACNNIKYPKQMLIAMLAMRGINPNNTRQQSGHRRQRQTHQRPHGNAPDPFTVLGVSRSDDKSTIRKAYKRLMSQNHPDKLIAQGLPPEMIKVAEEKAKKIQIAWEEVKKIKGY